MPRALLPPHRRVARSPPGDPADHRGPRGHHLRRRSVRARAHHISPWLLACPPWSSPCCITPVATELPEKFNSVMWMRQKKDTLALGQHHRGDGLPEHVPGGHRPGLHRVAPVGRGRHGTRPWPPESPCSRARCSTAGCVSPREGSEWARFSSEGALRRFPGRDPLVGPLAARPAERSVSDQGPGLGGRSTVAPPTRVPSTHCSSASATPSRRFDEVITSAAALAAGRGVAHGHAHARPTAAGRRRCRGRRWPSSARPGSASGGPIAGPWPPWRRRWT